MVGGAEGMDVTLEGITPDRMAVLRCSDAGGVVLALLYLDFPNERLRIDIEGGFAVYDNKTPEAARFAADVMRFKGQYFLNGALEVWDTDADRLLGRCDPFIPTNIMPTETWENFERHAVRFEEIATEREGGKSSNADDTKVSKPRSDTEG